VCLPEDEIDRLRFLDADRRELHRLSSSVSD
jgi:hypothetical protein